jgi:cell division protein FtsA
VGSNHITNDLSMALHTPLNTADNVKMTYGSLHTPSNDLIELPVIGDEETTHEVSLEVVYNVIYARVEETLMIIAQSIQKSGLKDQLGAGIVLTGGFTKMDGIRELAVAIFDNMPVRLAKPTEMEGLFDTLRDPSYSGAIGLLKYAAGGYAPYEIDVNKHMRHRNESLEERSAPDISDIAPHLDEEMDKISSSSDIRNELASISSSQSKKDEPSFFNKIWQWATQLF